MMHPSSSSSSSSTLDVITLKRTTKTTVNGRCMLYPKFLARVYALGETSPEIKNFLEKEGFYLSENLPPKKVAILKACRVKFFGLVEGLHLQEDLISKEYLSYTNNLIASLSGESTLDFTEKFMSHPLLKKIKQDYDENKSRSGILKYLATGLGKFEIFLNDPSLAQEVNEGMTVDVVDSKEQPFREDAVGSGWKLHLHIDMQKNNQSEIDIAYNILLEAFQKHNIQHIKAVVPFANINDMKNREISIYLKSELSSEASKIRSFVAEIETRFKEQGIVATPPDPSSANKQCGNSEYFSFRNEFFNNPRRYISGADASFMASFLNTHCQTLGEFLRTSDDQAQKIGALCTSLTPTVFTRLYQIFNIDADKVSLAIFFNKVFLPFLTQNSKLATQLLSGNYPNSSSSSSSSPSVVNVFFPHNPFQYQDIFQLESFDLKAQASNNNNLTISATESSLDAQTVLPVSPMPTTILGSTASGSFSSSSSSSSLPLLPLPTTQISQQQLLLPTFISPVTFSSHSSPPSSSLLSALSPSASATTVTVSGTTTTMSSSSSSSSLPPPTTVSTPTGGMTLTSLSTTSEEGGASKKQRRK